MSYDLVVIGAGPAGEKAAAQAAYWGKRVLVIGKDARPGGTMVAGAVPSKTMREAALYRTGFRNRDVYEVSLDLTPEAAIERPRRRTDPVLTMMAASAAANLQRNGADVVHSRATTAAD